MAVDATLARKMWARYTLMRDNGHTQFSDKAKRCKRFFIGDHWEQADKEALDEDRRPALTINKIISTMSNVLGEQIYNRTDIAFRPKRAGATMELANTLTSVFKQISDNNHLPWVRSDVFLDGIVTSRGYYEVRLDFEDSLFGEVKITKLNPRHVLIDPEAYSSDPKDWNDVVITRWMTLDDIKVRYSTKAAKEIEDTYSSASLFSDSAFDDENDDKFGTIKSSYADYFDDSQKYARRYRVLDRQYRVLDRVKHFADLRSGDLRPIPAEWGEDRIQQYLSENRFVSLTEKTIKRIRWTVVVGDVILHDDWSPYVEFTVVPYFPYFLDGTTVGLVENLLDVQQMLNKVSSQELHVANTTANSGWIIEQGALANMSIAELEHRGATTGLVLEVASPNGIRAIDKIKPNPVPTGLDRISYKAEEDIKSISGVSDYQTGQAREDVAAKAVIANKQSGQANLVKVLDSLNRCDAVLARVILSIIQYYYVEERVLYIAKNRLTGESETLEVNKEGEDGQIVNDLTIGEYEIVVTNEPERDTLEDSQYEQAMRLRTEAGIQISDEEIIKASRLRNKAELLKALEDAKSSPEAQERAQLELRRAQAEVKKLEAEAMQKMADAQLKQTQTQGGEGVELQKLQMEMQLKQKELELKIQMQREELAAKIELDRERLQAELEIKRQQSAADLVMKRAQSMASIEAAKKQPTNLGQP